MIQAWKLFCRIARKKLGDSGAEVTRFPGVTTPSVNRLAVKCTLEPTSPITSPITAVLQAVARRQAILAGRAPEI